MRVAGAATFLMLAGTAGGCLADPGFEALGTVDRAMVGWAYNGRGITAAEGEWFVGVDAGRDKGEVRLSARVGGDSWLVVMDEFEASSAYQQNGVRCNHREHGSSLNGGPEMPEVAVHCSGWGFARGTRNDQTAKDPATGDERLTAHFMVTRDGVRGADGRIASRGGGRDYDPSLPIDGRTYPSQEEFHFVLMTNDGTATVWFHFEGPVETIRDRA
jgi:hypothetical protein